MQRIKAEDLKHKKPKKQQDDDSDKPRDLKEYYVGFRGRLYATVIDMMLTLPIIMLVMTVWPQPDTFEALEQRYRQVMGQYAAGALGIKEFSLEIQQLRQDGLFSAMAYNTTVQTLLLAAVIVIFWVYRSATPGKMVLGMKIVDAASLEAPSKWQLFVRYLGYYPSMLPFFLGFFWIALDDKKQGFHDKIARTLVLYNEPHDEAWKEKNFRRQTVIALIIITLFVILLTIRGGL